MKKIYRYSEHKFLAFPKQKQLMIILEMLEVLEKNFHIDEYAQALQKSLLECLGFIENSGNHLLDSLKKYDLEKLSKVIDFRDELLKKHSLFLRDNDIIVKRYDSLNNEIRKFPLVIILDNLRSAFNVGSIVRTSECLGVSELALCGKTPGPENRKVLETSMETLHFVKMVSYKSTSEAIASYRMQGYEIVALELTTSSIMLEDYNPSTKVALVIGNESLGIAEEILASCDKILEIRMHGIKNSLNVSNATAIAIHTLTNKLEDNND